MHPFTLPYLAKIAALLKPATDAAGRTSGYVSLKTAHKAYAVFVLDQGNAATVALTIRKAQAVAGTGAVDCTENFRWWAILDTAASDAWVEQAVGPSFTTDAGVKVKIVVCEIDPALLPAGFACVGVKTGASNAANLTSATLQAMPLRWEGITAPSLLVD